MIEDSSRVLRVSRSPFLELAELLSSTRLGSTMPLTHTLSSRFVPNQLPTLSLSLPTSFSFRRFLGSTVLLAEVGIGGSLLMLRFYRFSLFFSSSSIVFLASATSSSFFAFIFVFSSPLPPSASPTRAAAEISKRLGTTSFFLSSHLSFPPLDMPLGGGGGSSSWECAFWFWSWFCNSSALHCFTLLCFAPHSSRWHSGLWRLDLEFGVGLHLDLDLTLESESELELATAASA